MKKRILIYTIICMFFTQTSWGQANLPKNTLKIGGDENYPPYEFIDKEDDFRGFNVDIIRAIAIELGIDIQLIPGRWDDTMSSLISGDVDAVQGMTLTPEREKLFDFTEEIVINSQNIFVLNETSNIADLSDLKGKKVAIQAEDVTKNIIKDVAGIIIIEKENQLEAIKSLLEKEVDAYVGNRATGIYNIQTYNLTNTVKIVGEPLYSTEYAIAVKKGDLELLNLLNSGLSEIKANGTYDKIYKKWFGEVLFDEAKQWRNIFYIISTAFLISLIFIGIIYMWNKRLKREVDIRTQQIVELNKQTIHNDKMRSLGKLSSSIAHEIRNPLTSIKAFIDMIPFKIEDDNFKSELMKIVPSEIKRLDDLVGSLLDYSKPKVSKPEKILLGDVLDIVFTLLNQKLQTSKIKTIVKVPELYIYVDKSQMQQILINIILNSIDAIEVEGIIEIEAKTRGNMTSINIKDNGKGVPNEIIDKAFDPFFTSKKTGYGIGLSVTDRLVKDNGGTIKLTSEENKGTDVEIIVPNDRRKDDK